LSYGLADLRIWGIQATVSPTANGTVSSTSARQRTQRAQEEGRIMKMSRRNALDTVSSFASAQEVFKAAWRDPNYTQFELPALDVNKVLNERYSVNPSIRLTRAMLWDMELKKAWDPSIYIPYVVSSGHSWGRHNLEDGCERFFRSSIQIAWISQDRGQVLEEVFINRNDRRIFFSAVRK
jgi:hypothetical protein